jgi:predicted nucleotidyltransferase
MHSIDDIKRIIAPVARRFGVERMYLFGSYARGDATPDSDIDFRVDIGEIHGYFMLAHFSAG